METNDDAIERTRRLVEKIVRNIALNPKEATVTVESLTKTSLICVRVAPSDMPRIIGRSGAHTRALQTIVQAISTNSGMPMRLHLIEPEAGERHPYGAFTPRKNWDSENVYALLVETANAAIPGGAEVQRTDTSVATEFIIVPQFRQPVSKFTAFVESCGVLWNAIGKAKGRIVIVAAGEPASVAG